MVIQKYRRGISRGYQVLEGGKVVDAASNRFLDDLAAMQKLWPHMPQTLRNMMLERWNEQSD